MIATPMGLSSGGPAPGDLPAERAAKTALSSVNIWGMSR